LCGMNTYKRGKEFHSVQFCSRCSNRVRCIHLFTWSPPEGEKRHQCNSSPDCIPDLTATKMSLGSTIWMKFWICLHILCQGY
jgi:hypothetical protein